MKKIFCIIGCFLLTGPVLADYWKKGNSERCLVHANASGAHDVFYYCYDQSKNCAGNNDASYDSRYWQKAGDKVSTGDSYGTQWCCPSGKYVRATEDFENSFTKEETVTIDLPNGKCSYIKITNACGNEVSNVPCTEPTPCESGKVRRNKECINTCQDGYAFESKESNNCIKCDTTMFSGIVFEGNNGDGSFCRKCDKDTAFYDKETKQCVPKTGMIQYSSAQMAKCFMCKSDDTFKTCLKGGPTNEQDCPIK